MSARRLVATGREKILALVLVAAAAALCNELAHRHAARFDWTRVGRHSLSDRTRAVLGALEEPVELVAVVSIPAAPESDAELTAARVLPDLTELFAAMKRAAPSGVSTRIVDALRDPPRARSLLSRARVRLPNVVLVARGQGAVRKQRVVGFERLLGRSPAGRGRAAEAAPFRGEEALLAAVEWVSGRRASGVFFTAGHGERRRGDRGPLGLSKLDGVLTSVGHDVQTLYLPTLEAVPAAANALVIAGPDVPFSAPEVARLASFVKRGGALLVLAGPLFDRGAPRPSGLETLLSTHGFTLGRDVVHDAGGAFTMARASTFLARELGEHSITALLEGEAIRVASPRSVLGPAVLLRTSGRARRAPTPEDAPLGPRGVVPLAAASANGGARIVVVGDSDLASNAHLDSPGNERFLLRALDWLLADAHSLSLPPRAPTAPRVVLSGREVRLAGWLVFLVVPGLTATFGAWVYFRRRRRG